jgi:hypothetical protein
MSKVINITDKLSKDKPTLVVGDKEYEVNDSMEVVLKFEELASELTIENMEKAITLALGKDAVKDMKILKMSLQNFKVYMIAILAAMQDISYEEAEARFPK